MTLDEIENNINAQLESIYEKRLKDTNDSSWDKKICDDVVDKLIDPLDEMELYELYFDNEPLLAEALWIESKFTKQPCIDDSKIALNFHLKTRAFTWYMKWNEKLFNS